MTWLRLDDGYASNPKVAQLTDREFRVWLRVLCYCAKYRDPSVDKVALKEIRDLTPARVDHYHRLGLLDKTGDDLVVHDWSNYLPKDPTGAERQARWRAARNGEVTEGVTDDIPF